MKNLKKLKYQKFEISGFIFGIQPKYENLKIFGFQPKYEKFENFWDPT